MTDPQPASPTPHPAGGGLGTASLAIGIVLVVVGLVQQALASTWPFWAGELPPYLAGMVFGAIGVVGGLIAIAGLVTGILGVLPQRPRGRLAAAAGLAVSGAHLVTWGVSLVLPTVLDLLL
jgi:hypothetical protein